MSDLKMPPRQPGDGPCGVRREDDGTVVVYATTYGKEGALELSEYNAWRLFGMLSVMLGLPVTRKVSKAIKLGQDPNKPLEITIGPKDPKNMSLGDRVAHELHMQVMKEELEKKGITMERKKKP